MKRIAVYYNATIRHQYGGEHQNDVEMFRSLLSPYMPEYEFIQFDPINGEMPADPTVFDGVILTGSAAMIGDDEPWIEGLLEHIRILDQAKTKLVGICFGHQAIAQALGGEVGPKNLSIGVPHLEVLEPQKWMHPYMPSLRLFAGNYQQVLKAPTSMKRVAIGRGNPNAMLVKDEHILSLQFHPELTQRFMEGYVDSCLAKQDISAHEYSEAKAEIAGGTDAKIMGKWIAHFFNH